LLYNRLSLISSTHYWDNVDKLIPECQTILDFDDGSGDSNSCKYHHQHINIQHSVLTGPSCRPANSVKALKVYMCVCMNVKESVKFVI